MEKQYEFTPAPYKLRTGHWKAEIVIEECFGGGVDVIRLPARETEYDRKEEVLKACKEPISKKEDPIP